MQGTGQSTLKAPQSAASFVSAWSIGKAAGGVAQQTFFETLSEQLPDVHFTIQRQDAVSMMAAMIREQRLEGILEGLRLAGLLNEAPKRRRTSPQTDGMG